MEVGSVDAEGIWSSLLYLLGWKMSLHVNFVKKPTCCIRNCRCSADQKWPVGVCVCAWGGGEGGGLSEGICSSGRKPVHR